ncbi:LUC7L [Cordylochernes scorpioides]|uniref:LUC7L n=1 Tax=Cordylochernes scorpioides TaxID=51811 RepID=A0ABY6K3H5_9ARAC|nr:LUC7L [Cordylochernes scorpioides]
MALCHLENLTNHHFELIVCGSHHLSQRDPPIVHVALERKVIPQPPLLLAKPNMVPCVGENNRYKVHFTDHRVCKSFLLNCCPHDILASTRMDLGECNKIHDHALRADYEKAAKKKDFFYDLDAMEHLQNFINDCDRRTEQSKRKLAESQEELSAEATTKAKGVAHFCIRLLQQRCCVVQLNRVHELAEQIGKKLAEAEKLGAEGLVEESLRAMEQVEEIKRQKFNAEQEYRSAMPASSYQQQKLRVCEVCSAYLGIHDNDRRLADHFGGKLHLGFITIRERLEELKKTVAERRQHGRAERPREPEERVAALPQRGASFEEKYESPRRRHRSRSREHRRRHRSRSNHRYEEDRHHHRHHDSLSLKLTLYLLDEWNEMMVNQQ